MLVLLLIVVAHLWCDVWTQFLQGIVYINKEGPNPGGSTPGSNNTNIYTDNSLSVSLCYSFPFPFSQVGGSNREKCRAACQGPQSMSRLFPAHPRQGLLKEEFQGHMFVKGMSNLQKYCPGATSHKPQAKAVLWDSWPVCFHSIQVC